jgi:hypothetical protein
MTIGPEPINKIVCMSVRFAMFYFLSIFIILKFAKSLDYIVKSLMIGDEDNEY